MNQTASQTSCEDVLDAFSIESNQGRETLERYIRAYPQYAADIIDVSRELARVVDENYRPLSDKDQSLIETAWKRHPKSQEASIVDPFVKLSVEDSRKIAKHLDVPRQIVTAFRERKVIVESIPQQIMARLAAAMGSSVEQIAAALAIATVPNIARSYKADAKPVVEKSVTFEQLLIEAGVSDEKRSILLADNN